MWNVEWWISYLLLLLGAAIQLKLLVDHTAASDGCLSTDSRCQHGGYFLEIWWSFAALISRWSFFFDAVMRYDTLSLPKANSNIDTRHAAESLRNWGPLCLSPPASCRLLLNPNRASKWPGKTILALKSEAIDLANIDKNNPIPLIQNTP